MKTILIFAALLVVTFARSTKPSIPIVSYDEQRDDRGQFVLSYVSGDGIKVSQQGILKPTSDGKDHVLIITGKYEYTAPNNKPISLSYTADENGFQPVGSHIPVVPAA